MQINRGLSGQNECMKWAKNEAEQKQPIGNYIDQWEITRQK